MVQSPTRSFAELIAEELAQGRPSRMLLLGMSWPELTRPPNLEVRTVTAELARQAPGAARADLAVVMHRDHGLDPALSLQRELACLLASLRDVHASRVLLGMPLAQDPTLQDAQRNLLRSMGFSDLGEVEHQGRMVLAHRFDVADYKPTPRWLNPDGWAHPELWNRHRW